MAGLAPRPLLVGAGVSFSGFCGIRDYWKALAESLDHWGWSAASVWWERDDEVSIWTAAGLKEFGIELSKLRDKDPTALVWNYSVFGYGIRGVPLFVPVVAWQLRRTGIPITLLLHEFGFPWWWPGWRGRVFAVTHRLALALVLLASSRVIVTTESRARWINSQRWLPRRPCTVVPVFSPVTPDATLRPRASNFTIGVFGYGARRMRADVVVEAVVHLLRQGRQVKLVLIGGAGAEAAGGRRWRDVARNLGCESAVEFTGPLTDTELSQALSDVTLMVFPDEAGASSRKTTLAAARAHEKCVVAFTGADEWAELLEGEVVTVVPQQPLALSRELARLLDDDVARRTQETKAGAFYRTRMGVTLAARQVISFAMAGAR